MLIHPLELRLQRVTVTIALDLVFDGCRFDPGTTLYIPNRCAVADIQTVGSLFVH
ncbi:MAG: hypothetical protein GY820_32365 [Gammaproteobacteria bacterium]|nr:hypothetical protein [Gammaproteobacteria bacterium]